MVSKRFQLTLWLCLTTLPAIAVPEQQQQSLAEAPRATASSSASDSTARTDRTAASPPSKGKAPAATKTTPGTVSKAQTRTTAPVPDNAPPSKSGSAAKASPDSKSGSAAKASPDSKSGSAAKASSDSKSGSDSKGSPDSKPSNEKSAPAKPGSEKKGSEPAQVLDPGQFFGEAAMGYAAAKACPEICAKLFCYCGCDVTDSHVSLLDCFTSYHGVDCHICQEESVLALRLHREGASLEEIQKKVDTQYSSQYPFEQDTPAYKKYKASRLWKKSESTGESPAADKAAGSKTDAAAGKETTPAESNKPPKVKPGFHVGNCCNGDKHPGSEKHPEKKDK